MKRLLLLIAVGLIFGLASLAWRIKRFGKSKTERRADVAIILGAALIDSTPSPVFAERLRHGCTLLRQARVNELILTGGIGRGQQKSESEAGRSFLVGMGIPVGNIHVESRSRTTLGNLIFARELMRANGWRHALIVSDPLHLRRALTMANDLQIEGWPEATPTSRYQSKGTQLGSLLYEMIFYLDYWIRSRRVHGLLLLKSIAAD